MGDFRIANQRKRRRCSIHNGNLPRGSGFIVIGILNAVGNGVDAGYGCIDRVFDRNRIRQVTIKGVICSRPQIGVGRTALVGDFNLPGNGNNRGSTIADGHLTGQGRLVPRSIGRFISDGVFAGLGSIDWVVGDYGLSEITINNVRRGSSCV